MLGRTANDLYWMARHMERAENMARLLEVGYRLIQVPHESSEDDWRSTLQSAACEKNYLKKYDTFDTAHVVDYLLFDPSNPASVSTSLSAARRNARAQRTAITRDMWECLNSAWLEFAALERKSCHRKLPDIFDWVKQRSALFRGAMLNTVLHNDGYYFPQLGTFLERADNTARILDVKYYVLLPHNQFVGGNVDSLQWQTILRSVTAHRSYRWVYKHGFKPWDIADFLILNGQMPRSLHACYLEITTALNGLARYYGHQPECCTNAHETLHLLSENKIQNIFKTGLHEFLGDFISSNNRLSGEIASTYHFNG